jgi:hypothetical protein
MGTWVRRKAPRESVEEAISGLSWSHIEADPIPTAERMAEVIRIPVPMVPEAVTVPEMTPIPGPEADEVGLSEGLSYRK